MTRRTPSLTIAALAFALLSVSPALTVRGLSQSDILSQSLAQSVNYLARNYDSSIGLVHESPDSAYLSNTYWLYSDNFLASLVFQGAGRDNMSLLLLAENLTRSMTHFIRGQPSTVNQYMVLVSSSFFPFNASKDFIFATLGTAVVKSTVNNQTGILDPTKYADIAFLEAIEYNNKGDDSHALQVFHKGTAFWNGTGFKDNAFTSTFATYKIALYLYTARLLGQTPDSSIVDGLITLQSHNGVDAGGFFTEYAGRFSPVSGSNTETTALAILALSQPESTNLSLGLIIVVTRPG